MRIDKVLALAERGHAGQFRKDGKTLYIQHPISICDWLYTLKYTSTPFAEELNKEDFNAYAIALMHDLLEDTSITDQEIFDVSNHYVSRCVNILTFKEDKNNPFCKMEYLKNIVNFGEIPLIIKCIDRICNTYDFYRDGNKVYAKNYFHKADILWNAIYQERSIFHNNLWNEIINLNNLFKNKELK